MRKNPGIQSQIKKTLNNKHELVLTSSMGQCAGKLSWSHLKEGYWRTAIHIPNLAHFYSIQQFCSIREVSLSPLCFTWVPICTWWRVGRSSIQTWPRGNPEDFQEPGDFHLAGPQASGWGLGKKSCNLREVLPSSAWFLIAQTHQDCNPQVT